MGISGKCRARMIVESCKSGDYSMVFWKTRGMSTATLSQRRERRGRYYTHYIYNKKAVIVICFGISDEMRRKLFEEVNKKRTDESNFALLVSPFDFHISFWLCCEMFSLRFTTKPHCIPPLVDFLHRQQQRRVQPWCVVFPNRLHFSLLAVPFYVRKQVLRP